MDDAIEVLIVEDNPGDANLARIFLDEYEPDCFKYEIVSSLEEMEEKLSHYTPDVVLLDLTLPDGDKEETLAQAELLMEALPVIVITGDEDSRSGLNAIHNGAQDYLFKNELTPNLLGKAVFYAIERKQSEEYLKQLNSILHAVRKIDEIVTQEREPLQIIRRACEELKHTRNYNCVWAVLEDKDGAVRELACAGDVCHGRSECGSQLEKKLKMCNVVPTATEFLKNNDIWLAPDISSLCPHCSKETCPMGVREKEGAGIAVALRYDNRCYGILIAIVPHPIYSNREERLLFKELANDIGLALHMNEVMDNEKRLEKELQQAQKLEAVGRLAAGIAHDFNNQLSGILANAEYLQMELKGNKELKESADDIANGALRSADLTKQLLVFSRQEGVEKIPFSIHVIIKEVIKLLERSLPKKIIPVTNLRAAVDTVNGEVSYLQNAFLNMAINGCDAMASGGILTVGTEDIEIDRDSHLLPLFNLVPGDYIKITISDEGEGIPEEIRGMVFEPFFTTKPTGKGTGLGLPAVYSTVIRHDGAIELDSVVGKGTTFSIYLPVFTGPKEKKIVEHQVLHKTGNGTIVVVDDEVAITTILRRILARNGYIPVVFNNAGDMERYLEDGGEIDLLITDIEMPDCDGIEMLLRFNETREAVPTIILSALATERLHLLRDKGIEYEFHTKPYRTVDLLETIHQLLM